MHYEVHGSGPPFFLHHGLTSSCQTWYQHLPELTRNHQVVIWDARGHGLTTAPAGDDYYSWELMCDDLDRLMQHLGIERAIIGGLSMGSGVSQTFALKYPEKVRALVLSDSAGTGVRATTATTVPREQLQRQRDERERVIREYGVVEQTRRTIAAGMAPRQVQENEKLQQEYLERLARFPVNGAIYANRFVMQTSVPGRERTAELTMPTLIVIGEEDAGCRPGAEWLRDTLPTRRFVLLTKVGHSSSRYKPEAWCKAVVDFLDDLERDADIQGEFTV